MDKQEFARWRSTPVKPMSKPLIMGILNVTTDSFSDGGSYLSQDKAIARAHTLVAEGADIIDIGAESSRPGAHEISLDEELQRLIPLIKAIRQESDILLSIDTSKPVVMEAVIAAGADMINDIYALRQPGALEVAARLQVPICVMHMQGTPGTMQENPVYNGGVVQSINHFFKERITTFLQAGIKQDNLILDPGFGFGKTVEHNLQIVKNLTEFAIHGKPLLLGFSRKHTLGVIVNKGVDERLIAGVSMTVIAAMQNVSILRTHDVAQTQQALQVVMALNGVC